jgi:hypothetical protein
MTVILGFSNIFNTFRAISSQGFFFIIDGIKFYQNHQTNYSGIAKIIF